MRPGPRQRRRQLLSWLITTGDEPTPACGRLAVAPEQLFAVALRRQDRADGLAAAALSIHDHINFFIGEAEFLHHHAVGAGTEKGLERIIKRLPQSLVRFSEGERTKCRGFFIRTNGHNLEILRNPI